MPLLTKICGLSSPETLDAAIAGGASHVGFMFFAPSPRNLDFDRARGLAQRVPERVTRVGVFVDPDDALIEAAVAAGQLAALQLVDTTAARRAHIKARTGLEIWSVLPVRSSADLAGRHHIEAADRILYDAKTPEGAALPGGMGVRFDWSLLKGLSHPLPWGLAGGLTAENLADAVAMTGARMVDTSSGVESAPGVKSVDKIAAFLESASRL
jgi:phosphoribosylanthranilate isomerase